jgi:hypothetical protein
MTIYCVLERARWSQKAASAEAKERNQELRTAWQGTQKIYNEDQLVFLDESSANERTSDRKYS